LSSQVVARFSLGDNVTAVVEGFANFFEIEDNVKVAIKGRALNGMAPGTFMVYGRGVGDGVVSVAMYSLLCQCVVKSGVSLK
jgi:hypothetical protein